MSKSTTMKNEETQPKRGIPCFWFIVIAIMLPVVFGFQDFFKEAVDIAIIFLFPLNLILIPFVELRLISQSAKLSPIGSYEKAKNTTSFIKDSITQQVVAKWFSVIHANRRYILFLYLLRYGTFFWVMVVDYLNKYEISRRSPILFNDIPLNIQLLIFAAVVMAIFLILEVMLVTILPLATNDTPENAKWVAVSYRIGLPILCLPLMLPAIVPSSTLLQIVNNLGLVIFDNGLLWIGQYLELGFPPTATTIAYIIGIGFYILWIWKTFESAKSVLDRRLSIIGKRKQKPNPS